MHSCFPIPANETLTVGQRHPLHPSYVILKAFNMQTVYLWNGKEVCDWMVECEDEAYLQKSP